VEELAVCIRQRSIKRSKNTDVKCHVLA